MMRLIDADVLIAEICQDQCERKYCDCDYTCSVVAPIVNAPTIPAVPLDKLCEWLAKNASWYATEIDGDPEEWKSILTEWMEEQDAVD